MNYIDTLKNLQIGNKALECMRGFVGHLSKKTVCFLGGGGVEKKILERLPMWFVYGHLWKAIAISGIHSTTGLKYHNKNGMQPAIFFFKVTVYFVCTTYALLATRYIRLVFLFYLYVCIMCLYGSGRANWSQLVGRSSHISVCFSYKI